MPINIITQPPAPPPTTVQSNAAGPRSVTADGQTATQHSLPDQIAADRYLRSNAAMASRRLPIRRVRYIRPGAAGYDRGLGGLNRFYDDPNWR